MSRVWLIGLTLASAAGGGPATAQTPGDTTTALHDVSGLRVIHRLQPGTDIVAVRLFLLGGTRQYTVQTTGIEPLLLRAAELETSRAMARAGGLTIAEYTPDWTVTGFRSLRADLDSAWAVFAARLTPPVLTEASTKRARDELLAAARRRYSHPDLRLQVLARSVAFADHPYALDPEGTEESLAALQRDDLAAYARAQFVTSRMLLVVVGNVGWGQVEPLVAATLGRLPPGDYRWTMPPPVPRHNGRWAVEHRPLGTNYIMGYFIGPDRTRSDYYAFELATALLSAGLHRRTRERSLSYAASAPFMDWAIPVGGVYASTSDPAEVYAQINREVSLLTDVARPSWVLSRFLDQWALDELAPRMSSDAQADELGRAYLLFGDFHAAGEHVHHLREVRDGSVRLAAQQYMKNLQLAFLGDTLRMSGKW